MKSKLIFVIGVIFLMGATPLVQAKDTCSPSWCKKAGTKVEHMICGDQILSVADVLMGVLYKKARKESQMYPTDTTFDAEHENFISTRNKTRTISGLRKLYIKYIDDLYGWLPEND